MSAPLNDGPETKTQRGHAKKGWLARQPDTIKVALIGGAATVAAALIGGIVSLSMGLWDGPENQPFSATNTRTSSIGTPTSTIPAPDLTPSGFRSREKSSDKVHVTFSEPPVDGPRISPGHAVLLKGKVEGLPARHALWILARAKDPKDPDTSYFVVGDFPVAHADGQWHVTNYSTGDDTDKGKAFEFYAVDATTGAGHCDAQLTAAAAANGGDRRVTFDVEQVCNVLRPPAVVHSTD
jgi:hypothetical protein